MSVVHQYGMWDISIPTDEECVSRLVIQRIRQEFLSGNRTGIYLSLPGR